MKNKIYLILFIFIGIICINSITYGKYVIEETTDIVARINIDRKRPVIDFLNLKNTNTIDINRVNKTHTITARIKITEENIKSNNFYAGNVTASVGNKIVDYNNMQIEIEEQTDDYIIYKIILSNLQENGSLKFEIAKGTIVDRSNNVNFKKYVYPTTKIDNIKPEYTFEEIEQDSGSVIAVIKANEPITKVSGWQLSEDKLTLTRVFSENATYVFKISDLAQNETQVQMTITKAKKNY